MFQVKKVATISGPCGTERVEVKREGSKQNTLVSDFRKIFARQISKVKLHRRRLQSKARKNLKVGAQHYKHECSAHWIQHLNALRIGFIVKACCAMSTVGLIHCN